MDISSKKFHCSACPKGYSSLETYQHHAYYKHSMEINTDNTSGNTILSLIPASSTTIEKFTSKQRQPPSTESPQSKRPLAPPSQSATVSASQMLQTPPPQPIMSAHSSTDPTDTTCDSRQPAFTAQYPSRTIAIRRQWVPTYSPLPRYNQLLLHLCVNYSHPQPWAFSR